MHWIHNKNKTYLGWVYQRGGGGLLSLQYLNVPGRRLVLLKQSKLQVQL